MGGPTNGPVYPVRGGVTVAPVDNDGPIDKDGDKVSPEVVALGMLRVIAMCYPTKI